MPKIGPQLHDPLDAQERVFDAVAHSLVDSTNVLVLGQSTSKLFFVRSVQQRDPSLEPKIVWLDAANAKLVAHYEDHFETPAGRGS